jgi:hypothetical protein
MQRIEKNLQELSEKFIRNSNMEYLWTFKGKKICSYSIKRSSQENGNGEIIYESQFIYFWQENMVTNLEKENCVINFKFRWN